MLTLKLKVLSDHTPATHMKEFSSSLSGSPGTHTTMKCCLHQESGRTRQFGKVPLERGAEVLGMAAVAMARMLVMTITVMA